MSWPRRIGMVIVFLSVLAIIAGGVGTLWWASSQSPEFYRVAEKQIANPVERKQAAQKFVEQSQQLVEEIKKSPEWSQEFTDSQINAWLMEDFTREFAEWIPVGVSQPRVQIQRDGIRIGVRVEQPDQWSGIVSLHGKVRVVAPNELAIELQSIQAGLVPVPLKTVIEQVSEHARESGVEIEWRQEGDRDIAIIRLTHEGTDAPQLEHIELRSGSIRVTGSSKPKSGAFQFMPQRLTQRPTIARQIGDGSTTVQ